MLCKRHAFRCLKVQRSAMEPVLRALVSRGLLDDATPSADVLDLDYLESRLDLLRDTFHERFFLHAAAVKANPIRGVLQVVRAKGMGAEAASISEVEHAIKLGFKPELIVYDSPTRTKEDLKRAMDLGVMLNLDNTHEVSLVAALLQGESRHSTSRFGLRINPVVGGGAIALVSNATKLSKFGVPVTALTRRRVVDLFLRHRWLTGVHAHVGSQGVPMHLFVRGARACVDLAAEVEAAAGKQVIEVVDIGGGLSSSYRHAEEPASLGFAQYRRQLERDVPELFSGRFRVVTEFGRALFNKAGATVTRVEHVKRWIPGLKPVIMTHVGTNQFVFESYMPSWCAHRFSLADPHGNMKAASTDNGKKEKHLYDIAGPLCFQGDYLGKDVEFPCEAEHGDLVVVHDTGAYTMAMYSKFNSILPSAVYGYRRDEEGGIRIFCFKERETTEENLKFWGNARPRLVR